MKYILKPKICFFSLDAYSYLTQKDTGTAGGAELQQVLLAKELVRRGFDISFIVDDYGQKSVEFVNGIKIFKCPFNRFNRLSYYLLKLYLLWKVLKKIDAEIYYQRAASAVTGIIALFCLLKKKMFVYGLGSDIEVNGTFTENAKLHERLLYNFGLKKAKCIITQSEYQQRLLKKRFNYDSTIIKNLYPLDEKIEKGKATPPVVLWVGTIKPEWKQPEVFLKLATAIPDAKFQMVGGVPSNKQFYDTIKKEAERIPNLEFVGFVPYPDVNEYFNNASILINTSSVEGFSNTFLQAWARYTPVVSLNVDPDEIICKYKLGFHSSTFEQMVEDVKRLLEDEKLREKMGMNGRKYVESEHDIKKIVEEYIIVFEEL